MRYPFVKGFDTHPEIIEVAKLPHETVNFGGIWHSDTVYLEQPPMATMLLARELPPYGGDTMFASMYAAYEALSPGMQRDARRPRGGEQLGAGRRLEDARGPHPRARVDDEEQHFVATHPVVRTHPETGRKALYVNPAHTASFVGMTEDGEPPAARSSCSSTRRAPSSRAASSGSRDRSPCGTTAARCTIPMNDYHGFTRRMHRITLAGDLPR